MVIILISSSLIITTAAFVYLAASRGYPCLSDPLCIKCGYDLRGVPSWPPTLCPECGSDLTRPHSIRLATYKRSPRAIWMSVCMVVAMVGIVLGGLFLMGHTRSQAFVMALPPNSPQAIAIQSNAQIIANLPQTANQPWGWQELDRRLNAGKLPQSDVSAAIDAYITWRTQHPSPSPSLVWEQPFLTNADGRKLIPAEQFGRLADSFFGKDPTVTLSPTIQNDTAAVCSLGYGNSWDLLNHRTIFALRSVTLEDGTIVQARSQYEQHASGQSSQRLSGSGGSTLPVVLTMKAKTLGPHTLTFVVDTALVDKATMQLLPSNNQPGQSNFWPTNLEIQHHELKIPCTVVAAGTPTVQLVTDRTGHQWPPAKVISVTAMPADTGTRLVVSIEGQMTDVDYDYNIRVNVNSKQREAGVVQHFGDTIGQWGNDIKVSPAIGADVTSVTIQLVPDLDRASKVPGARRVFNIPMTFDNVPLRRLDLPAATQP